MATKVNAIRPPKPPAAPLQVVITESEKPVEYHYPNNGASLTNEQRRSWLMVLRQHVLDELGKYGTWDVHYLDPSYSSSGRYVERVSNKQLYMAAEPLAGVRFDSPQEAFAWVAENVWRNA